MGFVAGEEIPEKNFRLKDGKAYTEDGILIFNIFVHNIAAKATEEEVREYFSQYGDVNLVNLVKVKRKSRRNAPKVGFIHFTDAVSAAKVLEQETPHSLKSKRIFVKACDSWSQPAVRKNYGKVTYFRDEPSQHGQPLKLTMLNDDCLIHIVKKLVPKDQVRFSMTCHRFKSIFQMVCKTEYKHLYMDLYFKSMTLWEIREFLIAAGPNIETLETLEGVVPFKYRHRIIDLIGKNCKNAKTIILENGKLKAPLLGKLVQRLELCTTLKLRDCQLTDSCILALKKLPNLETLSVASNFELTGDYIHHLTKVKDLVLNGCVNLQPSYFLEIIKSLKDLQSLDIQRCERLTNLSHMVDYCHKLESLKLSCPIMSYESISLLPNLKKLEVLPRVALISLDKLFQCLAKDKADQLESLKIVARNCVNPHQTFHIAHLTRLKSLSCANNEGITDLCLQKFAYLTNLEEIVLRNCRSITNEGLLTLVRRCTKLKKVNIQLCTGINDQFVSKVIQVLKSTESSREGPCLFFVAKSGISTFMANHPECIAASSLFKLSFYVPLTLEIEVNEVLQISDVSDDNDDDLDYQDILDYEDPYDMLGAFSEADDEDEDDIVNNVYHRLMNFGDDFYDYVW